MTWIRRALAALRRPRAPDRASVFAFPDWLTTRARWSVEGDFGGMVREGYRINSLVYAPVRCKARAIASVPLLAIHGDPANPDPLPADHPLARLVRQPNPWQTWRAFNEQRKTYLELAGNAYVYAERQGGAIRALYNLRPDRVRILAGADGLRGYYYLPPGRAADDGVPLLPEDVAHTRYPNPLDDLEGFGYGLPPLLAAARDLDTDNNVTAFIKLLFERGAMPMGMLRFDIPLTEQDAADAKRRFMERYGGYSAWTEPVVMDQGGGYERIGMTFDELGFDVLDARAESRVLAAFGVPPILIGTRYGIAHSTYSNYEQARAHFWQDVLVPELRMFEDDDRRLLTWADGATVYYDLSVVPALQADMPPLVQAAHTLWTMGVPPDQAFAAVGLTIERVRGEERP
jgi:HK97 family phage portal protein